MYMIYLLCGVDDACGSWYCKNGRCNYISNCQYDICHYLESCSVINNTAVCNIKPKKYFTLSKCSTCVCSTVTGKFSCTSKDCFPENVCESGKCDENTGNCIYTNRTYSGKDKCHNYKCIRDQVRYDFIWVLDDIHVKIFAHGIIQVVLIQNVVIFILEIQI